MRRGIVLHTLRVHPTGEEPGPSIDVLLPFYGDVGLMQEAVRSVLQQSDAEFRLIIVDDHQPDETVADWVAALEDTRISYHRNSRNLGANANYARALELASADLVVFMGADDRMLPNYVRRARAGFRRFGESASMFQPGVQVIDGDGQPSKPVADRVKSLLRPDAGDEWLLLEGEALARSLLAGNWTYFPSVCWRRSAIADRGFDPRFHVVQDLALILSLVADGAAMIVDGEPAFEYRRHALSDSSVKTWSAERFLEEERLFTSAAERFRAIGWRRAYRSARWHVTSRANALLMVPLALRRRELGAARLMLRHAASRTSA